jgi:ubiquinone/menaquinone biosynthesis C-methylase UbiE
MAQQYPGDERLQTEFNEWAAQGRGEEMERHHISIAEQTIALMNLQPSDRVLDLGCGAGWATRMLAQRVGEQGQVVGVDVSDEMIRRARVNVRDAENVLFVWGSAMQIPWQENYFTKVLSIESFYYYPDQDRALAELFRVCAPNAEIFILINLYKDNHYSLRWVSELAVPVHARSEAEYIELLKKHTFEDAKAQRIPDLTPTPDVYSGKWFANADELREFKRIGALLLTARKPDVQSPPRAFEVY